jgi:thiamine biosynthesis lipoprotein
MKQTKRYSLKIKACELVFGGIGKGYAADMAKKVMKEMGIEDGVVNASGDLTAWGHQADGKTLDDRCGQPEYATSYHWQI